METLNQVISTLLTNLTLKYIFFLSQMYKKMRISSAQEVHTTKGEEGSGNKQLQNDESTSGHQTRSN